MHGSQADVGDVDAAVLGNRNTAWFGPGWWGRYCTAPLTGFTRPTVPVALLATYNRRSIVEKAMSFGWDPASSGIVLLTMTDPRLIHDRVGTKSRRQTVSSGVAVMPHGFATDRIEPRDTEHPGPDAGDRVGAGLVTKTSPFDSTAAEYG